MSLTKTIISQTPASTVGKPRVDFNLSDFDAAIQTKGYDVIIEKAFKCACNTRSNTSALTDCQNCGGVQYVFVNPTQTRVIMHSMNNNTEHKDWTEAKIGTVSVTTREVDKLGFMDKITVLDGSTAYQERLYPSTVDGTTYSYSLYPVVEVEAMFLFVNSATQLTKLEVNTDYTISNNVVTFVNASLDGSTVTIRYRHRPVYYVIDIPRDTMNSPIRSKTTGKNEDITFPIHGIARRSHYVLDEENLAGTRLLDNSFGASAQLYPLQLSHLHIITIINQSCIALL
jgi:hypothetical protein